MTTRSLRILICLYLLSFVLAPLSAAEQGAKPTIVRRVQSEKSRDDRLERAIMTTLGESAAQADTPVHYYYNRVDLNGDGKPEALVYLFGPVVCGTGGCSAYVFQLEGARYKLISELSPARNPIVVSSSKTRGWKDLLVPVAGGGVQSEYYAILQFNGRQYPSNPTVPPAKPLQRKEKGVAFLDGSGAAPSGIVLRPRK